jgi:hypothetical protein
MGKGATSSYSRNMKVNAQSSTEMELIAADMYMPEMLWMLHFIQAQGYSTQCVGLYQDNISTQLLIKNGRMLSGKRTKHIKANFFFIKDRVDDREIKVFDCPTHEMWADVMTKPLQGMAFKVMRAELMNCPVNYEDPEVETDKDKTKSPVANLKTVTWKSVVATLFRTPQKCVGDNRVSRTKPGKDRCQWRTMYPRRTLGSAWLGGKEATG